MEEQNNIIVEDLIQEERTENSHITFNETEHQQMDEARMYVYSISKWSKFFYILTIIGIVFMALFGIVFIACSPLMKGMAATSSMPFWFMGILYLIMAGVCIIPVRYLKKIRESSETAIQMNDNNAMLDFLKYNKKLWKFFGIYTIVMIGLSLTVIPIVIAVSAMSAL